jgi:peptide chain release factor
MDKNMYIQITSGRGPVECTRVVARVVDIFLKEAKKNKVEARLMEQVKADYPGTLLSATIQLSGKEVQQFLSSWLGTIQWIAQSPYRKYHQRKNWFIGIEKTEIIGGFSWNEKEVVFETLRSGGPGGQHVNKTESAVRATHQPTGISVLVSERRSQLQNKKMAIERLKSKLEKWSAEQGSKFVTSKWDQHNVLERGNPVKVFNERLS